MHKTNCMQGIEAIDCCYSVNGRSIKNQIVNVSPEVALLRAINGEYQAKERASR